MYGASSQVPAWRNYVCGLYYILPIPGQLEKQYLPQVELQAHSTILATSSRTTLTQTFINPSATKGIREVKYTFPLYDGVSVVGFTCHVGDRTIVGEVKEKEKAREDFTQAVSRGETAGLFEQLDTADVFSTTVGNVPPGARVIIKITYLGELKHDMEVDGIRFTIPNIIAPRYGNAYSQYFNNTAQKAVGSGISITVDAEMAEGSFIQKILSPTHPIAVSMGTTSFAPNADPTMSKASATLSLDSVQLDNDFILQIAAKDTGVPKAVLETHPTIPNQRALMATLVPRFALPPEKPEIVFVCDRSGSMSGSNITLVRQALLVFLKSLPVGSMFNICSFGSTHSFLWPKSVSYSQETLDMAVRHVETFEANYGGTQMLEPLQSTIKQRYKDIPLEVMLLTDGAIWDQQTLFAYLNEQISGSKAPIRVFSLGVGSGVSHSLIEGIAKAGNGFSQTVGEGEKMDAKVVRMLKGALSPHITDYTLEVKYSSTKAVPQEEDDDFEIIEKVADSLTVKLDLNEKDAKQKPAKAISLFDTSVDLDKEEPPVQDETGEARYSHLPKLHIPNIIQAPQNITALFAFNRTTAYLLLGPDSPQQTPKSVILRGTSAHGPLELEFPIQVLETPGETIHQLAAKKAITELEACRGWLPEAKDESGQLVKERYESRFNSMVERETVRLGVQFQVSSKCCSFVAVEKKQKTDKEEEKNKWEWLEDERNVPSGGLFRQSSSTSSTTNQSLFSKVSSSFSFGKPSPQPQGRGGNPFSSSIGSSSTLFGSSQPVLGGSQAAVSPQALQGIIERGDSVDSLSSKSERLAKKSKAFKKGSVVPQMTGYQLPSASAGLVPQPTGFMQGPSLSAAAPSPPQMMQQQQHYQMSAFASPPPGAAPPPPPAPAMSQSSNPFSSANSGYGGGQNAQPKAKSAGLFGGSVGGGLFGNAGGSLGSTTAFGAAPAASAPPMKPSGIFGRSSSKSSPAFGGFGSAAAFGSAASTKSPFGAPPTAQAKPNTDDEILSFLIKLQTFEGYWEWKPELFGAIRIAEGGAEYERDAAGYEKVEWVTALVVAFFEERLEKLAGSWELVVDKAKGWLEGRVGGSEKVEEMVRKAKTLV